MSLLIHPFDPAHEAALVTGAGNGIGVLLNLLVLPALCLPARAPAAVDLVGADAHYEPRWNIACPQKLGEVLTGQVGGERPRQRWARAAHRGAERLELQAAGREGADAEGHADHAMAAERGTFGRHPVDRAAPRLVERCRFDQIPHGFGFRKIDAAIQKRPQRKLARLGQPCPQAHSPLQAVPQHNRSSMA